MSFDVIQAVRSCSQRNPQLAYQLALGKPVPQQYSLQVEFNNGAPDTILTAQLDTPLGDDLYIFDMRSTVTRPQAFAGSIFKAQSDVFNSQNSGITVRLQVLGGGPGNQYVLNSTQTPLELVAPPVASATTAALTPQEWVLTWGQTIRADFVLGRSYVGETPVRVAIVLNGWRLGCQNYDNIAVDIARTKVSEFLAGLGGR